jgi:metal-responsive CopG/Arc/MetJ family transcriptional regulator
MNGEVTTHEGRYLSVLFHEKMIAAIDNYRFDNRVESRTEAIRELIEWSLANRKKVAKRKAAMRSRVLPGSSTTAT